MDNNKSSFLNSPVEHIDITSFVILFSFIIADTLRVFFTRIISGKSPMTADTIHFHHLVLKGSGSYLVTLSMIFLVTLIFTPIFLKTFNSVLIKLGSTFLKAIFFPTKLAATT